MRHQHTFWIVALRQCTANTAVTGKNKPCSVAGCTTTSIRKHGGSNEQMCVWRLHQHDDGDHAAYLHHAWYGGNLHCAYSSECLTPAIKMPILFFLPVLRFKPVTLYICTQQRWMLARASAFERWVLKSRILIESFQGTAPACSPHASSIQASRIGDG